MSVDSEVQDGHWETDFLLGQWWTTRIGCPERQSLEVLEDLPRQSHKPSQTHIRVYEHVNPKLPVTLQHLTHKITPIHDRLLAGLWSDLIHCSLSPGALQAFVRSSTAERNGLQPSDSRELFKQQMHSFLTAAKVCFLNHSSINIHALFRGHWAAQSQLQRRGAYPKWAAQSSAWHASARPQWH